VTAAEKAAETAHKRFLKADAVMTKAQEKLAAVHAPVGGGM